MIYKYTLQDQGTTPEAKLTVSGSIALRFPSLSSAPSPRHYTSTVRNPNKHLLLPEHCNSILVRRDRRALLSILTKTHPRFSVSSPVGAPTDSGNASSPEQSARYSFCIAVSNPQTRTSRIMIHLQRPVRVHPFRSALHYTFVSEPPCHQHESYFHRWGHPLPPKQLEASRQGSSSCRPSSIFNPATAKPPCDP